MSARHQKSSRAVDVCAPSERSSVRRTSSGSSPASRRAAKNEATSAVARPTGGDHELASATGSVVVVHRKAELKDDGHRRRDVADEEVGERDADRDAGRDARHAEDERLQHQEPEESRRRRTEETEVRHRRARDGRRSVEVVL